MEHSNQSIMCQCKLCGYEKLTIVNNLIYNGFNCPFCTDISNNRLIIGLKLLIDELYELDNAYEDGAVTDFEESEILSQIDINKLAKINNNAITGNIFKINFLLSYIRSKTCVRVNVIIKPSNNPPTTSSGQ